MNKAKIFVAAVIMIVSAQAKAYGPYDQSYTMNQQYGASNWYSSPLGMGAAMMGTTLMSGIVNAMSRPSQPVVQQQPQVIYQQQGGYYQQNPGYQQPSANGVYPHPNNGYQAPQQYQQQASNCHQEEVFDQAGNPRRVNICQ